MGNGAIFLRISFYHPPHNALLFTTNIFLTLYRIGRRGLTFKIA